jgi:FkbM family methyltransferase
MNATGMQRLAARVSRWLGRDSLPVRLARPFYERVLDLATGGRGFARVINGRERFYVHPRWRHLVPESYEPAACEYLRSRVRGGACALNVGAHVGVYALCLARWSGPDGRVVAFEPNPKTRGILEEHVRRNGLTARIEVDARAIGEAPGTAEFFAAGAQGTNRIGAPNPEAGLPHRSFEVRLTTIDAACAERGIAPDWIVMDVEGFEVAALKGAAQTLRSGRGRIGLVVELHPHLWESSGTSREEFMALLEVHGLAARPLGAQSDPLVAPGVCALEWAGG